MGRAGEVMSPGEKGQVMSTHMIVGTLALSLHEPGSCRGLGTAVGQVGLWVKGHDKDGGDPWVSVDGSTLLA